MLGKMEEKRRKRLLAASSTVVMDTPLEDLKDLVKETSS